MKKGILIINELGNVSQNKVFLDISSKIKIKRLTEIALSLNKGFKSTRSNELNKMFDLVTELYFNDYKTEVSEVIEKVVDKIKFNGDRRLWVFIEPLLLLKCWILKNENKLDVQNTIEKIEETFFYGDNELAKSVNQKVRQRKLRGEHLYYDDIQKSIEDNDKEEELEFRKKQFYKLLYIYFLGGSNEFSTEKALEEIQENENLIKKHTTTANNV